MRAVLAALAAVVATPAVFAAPPENPLAKTSVVLRLDKLDLASIEGQRALAIRMDQAARDVCGDRVATIHLALEAQSRSCRADVLAELRTRIEQRTANADRASGAGIRVAMR